MVFARIPRRVFFKLPRPCSQGLVITDMISLYDILDINIKQPIQNLGFRVRFASPVDHLLVLCLPPLDAFFSCDGAMLPIETGRENAQ